MIEHDDNTIEHWSHYDQMLNKTIQKAFEDNADLETTIVSLIKKEGIKAVDIRDKLSVICSTKTDKPVKMLLEGKPLESTFETAQAYGGDNNALQKLTKFRDLISNPETKKAIAEANPKIKAQLKFELGLIRAKVSILLRASKTLTKKPTKIACAN